MKTTARGASVYRSHSGPNMTPLVDVVMVILVFLMLAGSFGSKEIFHDIQVGTAGPDGVPRPLPDPGRQLDVFVSGVDGAGGFTARLGADPRPLREPSELRAELERRRTEYAAVGTPPETVRVVIHPTAGTAWAPVVAAHEAAREARFTRTGFGIAR